MKSINMPKLMVITIVDALVFIFTFILLFVLNNEQRSFIFDVAISVVLLGKALFGLYFYKEKSLGKLRTYMVFRLLYNVFIGLVVVIFNYTSKTYPINFLATISVLSLSEIILFLSYSTCLCRM